MVRTNESGLRRVLCALAVIVTAMMISGTASAQMLSLPEQPSAEQLKPGLAVRYYHNYFRHIDEIVEWEKHRDGSRGEPLPHLDWKVGEGKVLTSNDVNGVGAKITGFIRLDKPGFYKFVFESNDGVRLEMGDEMILEDPGVHSDQFSPFGEIMIRKPGWYPLTIRYFERKVTSTLIMHWKPPGFEGDTLPKVPAEILAHIPE
ncbi:MAG: PA14 domain-containing protein [Rhodospirillales bacterium]|nr:PA14 domain-containing protein [Rhodospirillales bacterium]